MPEEKKKTDFSGIHFDDETIHPDIIYIQNIKDQFKERLQNRITELEKKKGKTPKDEYPVIRIQLLTKKVNKQEHNDYEIDIQIKETRRWLQSLDE